MEVSVVVPVRNASEHIRTCVSALEEQTFRDFEVIFVVDIASIDGSLEMIESLKTPLEISIVRQEDGSRLGGARNLGAKSSKGRYVWFCDVDDYPYPYLLEDAHRIAEERCASVLFFNHYQMMGGGIPDVPDREYGVREYRDHSAVGRFDELPVYSWSRIQRKEVLDTEFTDFKAYPAMEDLEQTVRTLCVVENVYYYEKPLYVYKKRLDSATKENRRKELEVLEETMTTLADMIRNDFPNQYPEFRRRMATRVMRQSAFAGYSEYMRHRRTTGALELLKEIDGRTLEMKTYLTFKRTYYLALFPFTHRIWDRKVGPWGSIDG